MPQRFIRKNPHKKLVRPASRLMVYPTAVEDVVVVKTEAVKENKQEIKEQEATDMNNIEQLKAIVGDDVKTPKRRVKVEKKDKGLFERTENSTIVLTEDDKMMLND